MVHGDGSASGQAGLDRTEQARTSLKMHSRAGVCRAARAASKLKSKAQDRRLLCAAMVSQPPALPPPTRNGSGGASSPGTVIKVQLGSEASGP